MWEHLFLQSKILFLFPKNTYKAFTFRHIPAVDILIEFTMHKHTSLRYNKYMKIMWENVFLQSIILCLFPKNTYKVYTFRYIPTIDILIKFTIHKHIWLKFTNTRRLCEKMYAISLSYFDFSQRILTKFTPFDTSQLLMSSLNLLSKNIRPFYVYHDFKSWKWSVSVFVKDVNLISAQKNLQNFLLEIHPIYLCWGCR